MLSHLNNEEFFNAGVSQEKNLINISKIPKIYHYFYDYFLTTLNFQFEIRYNDYIDNGTINKNYVESDRFSENEPEKGIYKSLKGRGFDLRSVASVDQEKTLHDFEFNSMNTVD